MATWTQTKARQRYQRRRPTAAHAASKPKPAAAAGSVQRGGSSGSTAARKKSVITLDEYELEVGDWVKLCASEGVPFGYTVRQVDVELYGGSKVPAYTLVGGAPFDLPPSERYLGLIREGAEELGLTRAWQDRLAKIPTAPFGNAPQPRDESFERRPGSTFI